MATDWSSYQSTLRYEIHARLGTSAHLVGNAVAGAGKSHLQIETIKDTVIPYVGDSGGKIALIAFNRNIRDSNELKLGLDSTAKSMTYHQFGLRLLRASYKGEGAPNPTKVYDWFTTNPKYSRSRWLG